GSNRGYEGGYRGYLVGGALGAGFFQRGFHYLAAGFTRADFLFWVFLVPLVADGSGAHFGVRPTKPEVIPVIAWAVLCVCPLSGHTGCTVSLDTLQPGKDLCEFHPSERIAWQVVLHGQPLAEISQVVSIELVSPAPAPQAENLLDLRASAFQLVRVIDGPEDQS